MGVGALQVDEIGRGEQVEDEPVIPLTQNIGWNTARLLRDKECAKIIFAPLFYPCDIRFSRRSPFVENGLGLFHDGNCWYRSGVGFCKLFLVAVKYTA